MYTDNPPPSYTFPSPHTPTSPLTTHHSPHSSYSLSLHTRSLSLTHRISPKLSSLSSNGGNSSHRTSHKSGTSTSYSSSSNSSSSSSSSSSGSGNSRHKINGIKSLVQDPKLLKALALDLPGVGSTLVTSANGDLSSLDGSRPLLAGNNKVHLPSGKKQALVKAVPRADQSSSATSDLEHKMQKVLCATYPVDVELSVVQARMMSSSPDQPLVPMIPGL